MNALQIWGVVVYALFSFVMALALLSFAPRYKPGKVIPIILFYLGVCAILTAGGYAFGWYVLSGLRMD